MYKIGQRVKVDNHNSSFIEDNRGTIVEKRIRYVVKLDSGLTVLMDSARILKLEAPPSKKGE